MGQAGEFRVARVHAPNMASERRLPAAWIVRVIEVIISMRVCTERRVVNFRRQRQWGAAAPATDELGGEEFPFFVGGAIRMEESIEGTDARLIFAQANKSAVATEYVRLRHRQRETCLTRIAEDELASLDRLAVRQGSGLLPSIDGWSMPSL